MQYRIYRNRDNSGNYPYLLDIQSDTMDLLETRLVIPLFVHKQVHTKLPTRLNPLIEIDGQSFVIMTHQMASVTKSLLDSEVADAISSKDQIKRARDLLIDGF
nr:CcdB family protein [uncultured Moellerella sp.]